MNPTPLPAPDDFSARVRRGLRDKCYVIPREAKRGPGPWITVRGVEGGVVENVTIVDFASESEVHPQSDMIAFEDCRDLKVRGLHVSGAGRHGIFVEGGRDLDFEFIRGERCQSQLRVLSQHSAEKRYGPTVGFRIAHARFTDGWNNDNTEKSVNPPSKLWPGQHMGLAGMYLHGVVYGEVDDVFIGGETGGGKLTTCRHVTVKNSVMKGMHLMGVQDFEKGNHAGHWTPGTEGGYGILLESCLFWSRLSDRFFGTEANGIQASLHVEARIVGCQIRSDGSNGHGIQAALNARVHVEHSLIGGWNGTRGGQSAAAFDVRPHEGDGSRITHDGCVFANQDRIWSDRVPEELRT